MYLQNKQENEGGAPIASPIPKSNQGIWRVKEFVCFPIKNVLPSMVSPPLLLWRRGRCPLFMGSRRFTSKMEGEGDALFACYDLIFPLDSQTAL